MRSKQASVALADITSAAANAAVDVERFESANIYVGGTFVGTFKVSESPDGTTYGDSYTGKTAPGVFALAAGTKYVKVTCTAYTSGTISSVVGGRDEDMIG